MTAICLTTIEDLEQASKIVDVSHQNEGKTSTLKKCEMTFRLLLVRSTNGAIYLVCSRIMPTGFVVLTFMSLVHCDCLAVISDEVYPRHRWCGKRIGKSILKCLFNMVKAHIFNSLSLEMSQKDFTAMQFFKVLEFRLPQNYNLIAMEV